MNGVVTKYTLHGKNVVHMTQGSNDLHFFYDAQNCPAVVVYNGTAYAYAKNLQGDIVGILDNAGNWVVEYTYDAWGAPTSLTGSMASTLGVINPFRYRGYVYDQETGLYYLRSRYYDPTLCRFCIADVMLGRVACLLSSSAYTYCKNSPVARFDESGCEDIYVFYYHRKDSKASLITQAQSAIYYDSNAENVHMIEVGYSQELIDAWNAMEDSNLGNVYFILHGSAGRIVFDEPNGEYISFSNDNGNALFSDFNSKKVKGAIYMLNCHGADDKRGQSVAAFFSNLCRADVYACVCGVSYTKFTSSQRTHAREEKKEFINPFTFNWRLFRYTKDMIVEYILFSKWLN